MKIKHFNFTALLLLTIFYTVEVHLCFIGLDIYLPYLMFKTDINIYYSIAGFDVNLFMIFRSLYFYDVLLLLSSFSIIFNFLRFYTIRITITKE